MHNVKGVKERESDYDILVEVVTEDKEDSE